MPLQQISLASLPQRKWDVVVVGAGPAGAACSLYLAKKGHTVLVVDKGRFPRNKPCGDLLISDSISMLKQLGLYERIRSVAYEIAGIDVFSPLGARFEIPGAYMSLKRQQLDEELMRHAGKAGAIFAQGNIVDVKPGIGGDSAKVYSSQAGEAILARTVVLATGGVVTLPHRLGLVMTKEPSAVGIRHYVRSRYRQNSVIVSYGRSILPGYAWITPLGRDSGGFWLYNVGCGTSYRFIKDRGHDLKKTLKAFLREFPSARLLMAEGQAISPVRGAVLRSGLSDGGAAQRTNMLAVGEVIGTTFPFTGEGIGKAMESGHIAAGIVHDALVSGDMSRLDRYPSALDAELRPLYVGYEKAEKWLSHRWLNEFVLQRVSRSRFLKEQLRGLMSGSEDPRLLFSVKSLLLSYLK